MYVCKSIRGSRRILFTINITVTGYCSCDVNVNALGDIKLKLVTNTGANTCFTLFQEELIA